MMLRSRLLAPVALLVALLLAAQPAHAQGNSPATWRALYLGELGGRAATLDLTLGDGANGFAFARLQLEGAGGPWEGVGEGGTESDTFTLTLYQPSAPAPASVAIDIAYFGGAGQADEAGASVATLSGSRALDWAQDGATLEVRLEPADDDPLTGTLERTAQYAFGRVVQGRIDVGFAYPRFPDSPALTDLLEVRSGSRLMEWLHEGRQLLEEGEALGWAWTHHEGVDLVGAAGPYRSLLASYYYYTGGAHPNSHSESLLVELDGGTARLLTLESLFEPGTGWLELLSARLLEELALQEAGWVADGSLTELDAADLATFTLGPSGLTFHFAPYAVGPYVQGAFRVTLGYAELWPLARAGGALEAFAAAQ